MNDSTPEKTIPLLIAGMGNSLLMDDGVGIHALRLLEDAPIPGARLLEVGTAVFDALDWIERSQRMIALDAVQAGEATGSVYELDPEAVEGANSFRSIHEMGLMEAMKSIPESLRPELVILGMEPKVIDYGLELSAEAQTAMPDFIKAIRETAQRLLG